MAVKSFLSRAEDFIKFVNQSRSPYHAVATCKASLKESGFEEIREADSFNLKLGGRYYYSRNQSSLVAFTVGHKFKPGNPFSVVGAHTDSPVIKVKPVSNYEGSGYFHVGCATYGGGLWHTWFDRDLTVAGRVIIKTDTSFESRLVYIPKPILRIPNLAIHLDRGVSDGFKFNTETHLRPILETAIKSQLATKGTDEHNKSFINLIARTLGVDSETIHSFDLSVCDFQDASIGGINDEFIFSARLDNLMSSFCGLEALRETASDASLQNDESVRMLVLFDHEEIGSRSAYGAMSPLLDEAIERICFAFKSESVMLSDLVHVTKRKSFLISADMAHAIHPNYPEKHDSKHQPAIHKGPVIKYNVEQRYATSAETSLIIEQLARKHSIPVQRFSVRNDMPCGSTIGPILSAETGIRTADIGNPQLSMHSIREMCGVDDTAHSIQLFKAFYEEFPELDKSFKLE